ncbi:MAG: peptidylprolyl isomerase [Pseudomonadota bacterium]
MPRLAISLAIGRFDVELDASRAPQTCAYFADLARAGELAKGSVFRITDDTNQRERDVPIHVVQFGLTNAMAAPRMAVAHEATNETGLHHSRWAVSAARFDAGHLYGSFFVCLRDEPALDYGGRRQPDGLGFAVFGHVVAGFDTIRALHRVAGPSEMLEHPIPVTDAQLTKSASYDPIDSDHRE